ncbi:MAG: translation initiation factor [Verrucomicrobia bacterium]|nr:MAG: translation initiation factor [Verrucomicrobiota bacterium]
MNRSEKGKIATDGGAGLGQNPFARGLAGLGDLVNLPSGPAAERPSQPSSGGGVKGATPGPDKPKTRGRVDVLRTTAGRGGKTVTVVRNFVGIGLPEKEALCKKMRAAAGCGGSVKEGEIEIQGDQREAVSRVLSEAGFRVVLAGG